MACSLRVPGCCSASPVEEALLALQKPLRSSSSQGSAASSQPRWLQPEGAFWTARRLAPWLLGGAVGLCAGGFAIGFLLVGTDFRHGDAFRIIYIHVPATWVALFVYALFAVWSGLALLARMKLAPMMTEALAPTGALFALLALWTGSLWGKPVSGLWWDWDARRITDLALLSLFVASMVVREVVDDTPRADRITAGLALAGAVVVLTALSSVAVLPQSGGQHGGYPAGGSGQQGRLLGALAAVAAGFALYASAAVLTRLRCVILERDRAAAWVAERGADER